MKKIEAIVRPEKLTETIKGLKNIGITGFTVSQVVGRGKQKDTQGVYRGKNYNVTLIDSSQTGEEGDGKIYVYPILEAYNIRTGTTDFDIDDLANKED
jgi:nitrogen regulatory protein P-II 1